MKESKGGKGSPISIGSALIRNVPQSALGTQRHDKKTDLREMLMNSKALKRMSSEALAQVDERISVKQYLSEGLIIMKDANRLLENLKQGNYNNYLETAPGSEIAPFELSKIGDTTIDD